METDGKSVLLHVLYTNRSCAYNKASVGGCRLEYSTAGVNLNAAVAQTPYESGVCMASLSALGLLVLILSVVARRRVERALPIAVCLWMLLLTGFAAFNRLNWMPWIALALLAVEASVLLFTIFQRTPAGFWRDLQTYFLTPGLLIFLILVIALPILCRPMVVWWADDLYYWALVPKGMWTLNGLTDAFGSLAGGFGTYTPGMPVLQWQMCSFYGEFREDILYTTLFLSYAVFLLPLCERIVWRKFWLIPLAAAGLIVLPLLANVLSYTFLCVDTALAACFAFVLLSVYDEHWDPLAVIAGGIGLVLFKQVGLLLGFGALALALLRHGGRKADNRVGTARVLLCWLAPVLTLALWLLTCNGVGLAGSHDENTLQNLLAMAQGTFQWPADWKLMPSALWYGLTRWPTTERLLTALPLISMPKLGWLVLLVAAPWLQVRTQGVRHALRLSLFALGLTAAYLLFILFSFATTFNHEIASYTGENINNISLLLERYLAPLLLGLGALELFEVFRALRVPRVTQLRSTGFAAALLLGCVLLVDWGSLRDTLYPNGYMNREDIYAVADQTEETNFWADTLTDRKDAVILIGFSNDAEFVGNLGYTFAPARFELPVSHSDDPDRLSDDIRNRSITQVVCLDDANDLYTGAALLTEDGFLDTYTLYAVEDDGSTVTLLSME